MIKITTRTIIISFSESDPKGVRKVTIMDSIVKAFLVPRARVKDMNMKDLQHPSIYFLFGETDDVSKPEVYIGEAEDLSTRLKYHDYSREWKHAICFFSATENLNKAHVKYLESFCHEEVEKANRYYLQNKKTPKISSLTDEDKSFVLKFFEDMKIIISVLGHPIFDSVNKEKKNVIYCAEAQGIYSEDGLLVFKDSKCRLEEVASIREKTKTTRNQLKDKGILSEKDNSLEFTEDHLFSSFSIAASVILGREANGLREWKTKDGKILGEVK